MRLNAKNKCALISLRSVVRLHCTALHFAQDDPGVEPRLGNWFREIPQSKAGKEKRASGWGALV